MPHLLPTVQRFALVGLLLLVTACADRLTTDNFERLKPGMSLDEVEAILGSGEQEDTGSSSLLKAGLSGGKYRWREDGRQIVLEFEQGKLRTRVKLGF